MMDYLGLLILIACAMFFYRAAEYEGMSPWPWAVASLGLTVVVSTLAADVTMVLLAQVGLFGAMWWYNVRRADRRPK
jgi:hypothetical protein